MPLEKKPTRSKPHKKVEDGASSAFMSSSAPRITDLSAARAAAGVCTPRALGVAPGAAVPDRVALAAALDLRATRGLDEGPAAALRLDLDTAALAAPSSTFLWGLEREGFFSRGTRASVIWRSSGCRGSVYALSPA